MQIVLMYIDLILPTNAKESRISTLTGRIILLDNCHI